MSTQRTLKRNLIVHRDLNIGYGTEVQERGDYTATEQKIELMFIFRTLDEIRYLDQFLYTRVGLHVDDEPVVEYWFDVNSSASDDGVNVLAPLPATSTGRWVKITPTPAVYTNIELNDITHAANTSAAKKMGYMVWNSDAGRPVWASDGGNGAVWVDATGATINTPV